MEHWFRARRALLVVGVTALIALAWTGSNLLVPTPVSAASGFAGVGFTDVDGTEWFASAALALEDQGIVYPKADGSFGPDDPVTRGEVAVLLNRVLGTALPVPVSGTATPFSDCGPYDWYTPAVANLYAAGLIAGTSSTTFSPRAIVNRQQAISFVMRALAYTWTRQTPPLDKALAAEEVPAWLAGFHDRELIDAAHASAIANACRLAIIQGDGDGWFYPALTVTRAQLVTMIYRAFLSPPATLSTSPAEVPAVNSYPRLSRGSEGTLVSLLESRLTDLRYPCGTVDRTFDERTRDAVLAFEKVEGMPRDGVVGEQVWDRLFSAQTPTPRYTKDGNRVEVDLTRQVLLMISDNVVTEVVHISTGKLGTPTGHGDVWLRQQGWQRVTVGMMYYPCYFYPHIAIHGSGSVPTYPASHGCVRTPTWISQHLYEELPMGTGVDVYY